jgi:hypothetical protein
MCTWDQKTLVSFRGKLAAQNVPLENVPFSYSDEVTFGWEWDASTVGGAHEGFGRPRTGFATYFYQQ